MLKSLAIGLAVSFFAADDSTDSQLLAVIHAYGKLPKPQGKKLPRLVSMVHSKATLKLLQQAATDAGIIADFILSNDLESGALVCMPSFRSGVLRRTHHRLFE